MDSDFGGQVVSKRTGKPYTKSGWEAMKDALDSNGQPIINPATGKAYTRSSRRGAQPVLDSKGEEMIDENTGRVITRNMWYQRRSRQKKKREKDTAANGGIAGAIDGSAPGSDDRAL